MRLGNREITLGEHYTISIAGSNVVSVPGRNAVRRLLREETGMDRSLPDGWDWSLSIPNQPKFTTRVSKFYADRYDRNLSPSIISQIGNLAQQFAQLKSDDYYIDFVGDFGWQAGDFGDSGSCFWGGRGFARELMRLNGGLAVRFWRDAEHSQGLARAWIAPEKPDCHMFIVYNGYGMEEARYGSTRPISSLLATWMGLDVKQIDLSNEGDDDGTLYINSASGYLIDEAGAIARWGRYDLHYVDPSVGCYGCGSRYDRNTCIHYDNEYNEADRWYCPHCAPQYIGTCEHCNCVLDSYDSTRISPNGRWGDDHYRGVCPRCTQLYATCHQCHTYHLSDEMTTVRVGGGFGGTREVLVCSGCVNRFATCDNCHTRFVRQRDETHCDRCNREHQWQAAEQARRRARQANFNSSYAAANETIVNLYSATVNADQIRFTTTQEPDGTIVIRASVED